MGRGLTVRARHGGQAAERRTRKKQSQIPQVQDRHLGHPAYEETYGVNGNGAE